MENAQSEKEKHVVDNTVGKLKVSDDAKKKSKPKQLGKTKNETVKVDLSKNKKDAVQESSTKEEVLQPITPESKEGKESEVELQAVGSTHEKEEPTKEVEEITVIEETPTDTVTKEEIKKPESDLPDNLEKLVSFMNETGGSLEDYVRLNRDYSNVNEDTLLKEYYKKTRPHLDAEEIDFILEDKFKIDADYDEDKEIRKKKLAKKEEVAKAHGFLEEVKKKYYDEIKSRPTINNETQKAVDFFNRYKNDQQRAEKQHKEFSDLTNKYFNEDFKGFDFDLGDKKFRYKVKNPADVANAQTKITDFFKTFLNEDGSVKDHAGYHKAIYAARNMDSIANHFYEQGKADAVKDVVAKSKNISNAPRQTPSDQIMLNGLRIKSVSGVDSSKLKIKSRKRT